jgi:hypothetical protein
MRGHWLLALGAVCGWAGVCGPAGAQDAPAARPLRVIGAAPAAQDPAPQRFVIDAVIKPGDAPFQATVEGWFAALPPSTGSGELTGSCVEARCALSADLDDGKLAITGDLAGPGAPTAGRFVMKDGDDKTVGQGAVSFALATGEIEGVGALAAPDAVSAAELDDLLEWSGPGTGFSNVDKDWPDDTEREALAGWQGAAGKPVTGLILIADLAELRAETAKAKAEAGWTALGDPNQGWTAGYPAKLLPAASRVGNERRYDSADGKARLVVAIDPPLDRDAFDTLVDTLTADRDGVEDRSYVRVNDEMEISFKENGVITSAAYHRRDGGLARIVFTYPAGQADTYDRFKDLLPRSLKAADKLNAH